MDEEVVDESSVTNRGQPGEDLGAAQPRRVRLVLDLVADADEPVAPGTVGETGELFTDRRCGEVDPSDDSGDQSARRGRGGEELLGFGGVADGLHEHRRRDPRGGGLGPEVGQVVTAADRFERRPGHPRVGAASRIPQVMVGVDLQESAVGIGASARSSPAPTRSCQRAAGIAAEYHPTAWSTCAADAAPTSTHATAGWASGNCIAAAGSVTRWSRHTAASRRARCSKLRRCLHVVVESVGGNVVAGEDPGVEHPADDDGDAVLDRGGKEVVEGAPVRAGCSGRRGGRHRRRRSRRSGRATTPSSSRRRSPPRRRRREARRASAAPSRAPRPCDRRDRG